MIKVSSIFVVVAPLYALFMSFFFFHSVVHRLIYYPQEDDVSHISEGTLRKNSELLCCPWV